MNTEKLNRLFRNKDIYIADSSIHGRGVFTEIDILPGEIIEQAHVVHPKDKNIQKADENYLQYFFFWPMLSEDWRSKVDEQGVLSMDQISYPACVLGFGMIYNHSQEPNVVFSIDTENNTIEYRAKRKILSGEELTICYNSNLKFANEPCK